MIKKIGYYSLSILAFFILLSPFKFISTELVKGNCLYYVPLIVMVFFSPSINDLFLKKIDRIFSSENLIIGCKRLILFTMLSLVFSFFFGNLISGSITAAMIIIGHQLSTLRSNYINEYK